MFYLLGRGQRGNDGCQFCHGTQLCGARKRGFIFCKKKTKKQPSSWIHIQAECRESGRNKCMELSPWNLKSAVMARGIVLQTLLGLFFLSDLGQKIYRARSPSTEYTEYQLWFSHVHKPKPKVRPDCSFFGCVLWFVLTWSGHCASSKVENRVEVAQIVWTEALRAKKEMEMFLFTCRNVSIPAGQRPGQCLDKTKQWRRVLGGESPWLCSHILEGCQECENPKLLKWRVMEQVLPEKNQKNCLYQFESSASSASVKAGISPFIFGCFEVPTARTFRVNETFSAFTKQ